MNPKVALHIYDPSRKIQLRIEGTATLHARDALADDAWSKTRPFSRVGYRATSVPGQPIPRPVTSMATVKSEDKEAGRENFGAIALSVASIEWLYIAASGHRRARFSWDDGSPRATWLAP